MSDALLEVRNLSKTFATKGSLFGRLRRVVGVEDVSFAIGRGRILGLVGESGSGKSTLARLLVRLIEADRGEILFDGVDIRALTPLSLRRMRRRFQIVAQDPGSSFDPRVSVGAVIKQSIRLHRLRSEVHIADRMAELLELVGLSPQLATRYAHQLSGGQLQRLAIARALSVEPELIVLDEVVSALDVLAQTQILGLIADLRRRLGVGFVFISHDLAVVHEIATEIGVLLSGRLVELGSTAEVVDRPKHAYTRKLLAAAQHVRVPAELLRGRMALLFENREVEGEADRGAEIRNP
jgi:ABC-type glutathione transport system ATPase component